jgi:hypothetical protein
MEEDKKYVLKKLDFSEKEFLELRSKENKLYWDYPSYMPLFKKYFNLSKTFLRSILPFTPSILIEKEFR